MKATLEKYWHAIGSSYWFIPGIMAVVAVCLALLATSVDRAIGDEWITRYSWLERMGPDGARGMLSGIGSSMITVAGVIFSITLAAVSYASSQFGPRVITNFMQDRGNQITLGTFIATFLYCLVALRSVHGDEGPREAAFVPQLAVLLALAFAVSSTGVLIFFIHHAPDSMHASSVVALIGRDLHHRIGVTWPDPDGDLDPRRGPRDHEEIPDSFDRASVPVRARGNGYVQHVDHQSLVRLGRDCDLVIRVELEPGRFMAEGRPLVRVWPPDRVTPDVTRRIQQAYAWGRRRTQDQDLLFLASELVEIATRALSPSTNDPVTANTCLDWLSSALMNAGRRRLPSPYLRDEEGVLRVIAPVPSFEEFARLVFDSLRPHVIGDPRVTTHTLNVIADVMEEIASQSRREALFHHGEALYAAARRAFDDPRDLAAMGAAYRRVAVLLHDTSRPGVPLEVDDDPT